MIVNPDKSIARLDIPPDYNAATIKIPTLSMPVELLEVMPKYYGDAGVFGRFVVFD